MPSNVRKLEEGDTERACKELLLGALHLIHKSNKVSELQYIKERKCFQCQSSTWEPLYSISLMY